MTKERLSKRSGAAQRMRLRFYREGRYACEACGWRPPDHSWRGAMPGVLHVHHIIPVLAGGPDAEDNLVLLCPNHHALAHLAAPMRSGQHWGPKTREDLFARLREYDSGAPRKDGQGIGAALVEEAF
jgi:5-methylcytosine-specific restriction endonuclease McrA